MTNMLETLHRYRRIKIYATGVGNERNYKVVYHYSRGFLEIPPEEGNVQAIMPDEAQDNIHDLIEGSDNHH